MPQSRTHDHLPGREAKLLRNNESQAVRIPADFEMPGDPVMIHRDGDCLILEPVRCRSLLAVLAELEPLGPEDQFRDIDDSLVSLRGVDLEANFTWSTPASCPTCFETRKAR